MRMAIIIPVIIRRSVAPVRPRIRSVTGWVPWNEMPQSPWMYFVAQVTYWRYTGWSSP